MKSNIFLIAAAVLTLSSCVTLGKYEALEATNNKLKKEHNVTRQELLDLKEEHATLQRQFQAQGAELTDLLAAKLTLEDSLALLRIEMGNLRLGLDTLIEDYSQRIEGQSTQLARTQGQLAARTRELEIRNKELADKEQALNERDQAFAREQAEFNRKSQEFERKYAELQAKEAAAQRALKAKEKELETVRTAVSRALVGFKDKGLAVEVRDGKVYVSMESKLMFASGSWAVSKEGQQAIQGLAKVLEDNPDLHIMVEGHTDNDAFRGSTAVKDNWDLSVMRATAIVKLLLQSGPRIDPARVQAAGHSEYAPKVANDSPAHKAQNRRTEIILTPDLDALLRAVE